jgi:hypothetical protein
MVLRLKNNLATESNSIISYMRKKVAYYGEQVKSQLRTGNLFGRETDEKQMRIFGLGKREFLYHLWFYKENQE